MSGVIGIFLALVGTVGTVIFIDTFLSPKGEWEDEYEKSREKRKSVWKG